MGVYNGINESNLAQDDILSLVGRAGRSLSSLSQFGKKAKDQEKLNALRLARGLKEENRNLEIDKQTQIMSDKQIAQDDVSAIDNAQRSAIDSVFDYNAYGKSKKVGVGTVIGEVSDAQIQSLNAQRSKDAFVRASVDANLARENNNRYNKITSQARKNAVEKMGSGRLEQTEVNLLKSRELDAMSDKLNAEIKSAKSNNAKDNLEKDLHIIDMERNNRAALADEDAYRLAKRSEQRKLDQASVNNGYESRADEINQKKIYQAALTAFGVSDPANLTGAASDIWNWYTDNGKSKKLDPTKLKLISQYNTAKKYLSRINPQIPGYGALAERLGAVNRAWRGTDSSIDADGNKVAATQGHDNPESYMQSFIAEMQPVMNAIDQGKMKQQLEIEKQKRLQNKYTVQNLKNAGSGDRTEAIVKKYSNGVIASEYNTYANSKNIESLKYVDIDRVGAVIGKFHSISDPAYFDGTPSEYKEFIQEITGNDGWFSTDSDKYKKYLAEYSTVERKAIIDMLDNVSANDSLNTFHSDIRAKRLLRKERKSNIISSAGAKAYTDKNSALRDSFEEFRPDTYNGTESIFDSSRIKLSNGSKANVEITSGEGLNDYASEVKFTILSKDGTDHSYTAEELVNDYDKIIELFNPDPTAPLTGDEYETLKEKLVSTVKGSEKYLKDTKNGIATLNKIKRLLKMMPEEDAYMEWLSTDSHPINTDQSAYVRALGGMIRSIAVSGIRGGDRSKTHPVELLNKSNPVRKYTSYLIGNGVDKNTAIKKATVAAENKKLYFTPSRLDPNSINEIIRKSESKETEAEMEQKAAEEKFMNAQEERRLKNISLQKEVGNY